MSIRSTWIGGLLLAGYLASWLLRRYVHVAPFAWVCLLWGLVT